MSQVTLAGNAIKVGGTFPAKGSKAPAFTLTTGELGEATLATYAGKRKVLNIFPSVDTGVCAASVRHFNQDASKLANTVVAGAHGAADGFDQGRIAVEVRKALTQIDGTVPCGPGRHGAEDGGADIRQAAGKGHGHGVSAMGIGVTQAFVACNARSMIFDTMNAIPVPRGWARTPGSSSAGRTERFTSPSGTQRAYRAASAAA